ncbi:hypothetical protein Vadar_012770 [Vaccinium darrowii]|uniref:Uncharacterized protein n=1 Tax=Vaccinium darrowii TaxID=229202 RepID=A0ACB7Z3J1_9ERIC|nr:hypothetical protein Vadar_012770 [Vaccinium darrowii]
MAVTLRDYEGVLINGAVGSACISSPLQGELLAIQRACGTGKDLGLHGFEIEFDNQVAIKLNVSELDPPWEVSAVVWDITQLGLELKIKRRDPLQNQETYESIADRIRTSAGIGETTSTAVSSIRSSSYVTTMAKNAAKRVGASSCTTTLAVSHLVSDRSQQPCLSLIWLQIWSSSCLDCHEQLPASKFAIESMSTMEIVC